MMKTGRAIRRRKSRIPASKARRTTNPKKKSRKPKRNPRNIMMERNRATPMTTMMTTTMTMMTKAQKATMTIRISKRIKSQTYCLKCGRATRLMKNTSN
jgi:hypothetical protein